MRAGAASAQVIPDHAMLPLREECVLPFQQHLGARTAVPREMCEKIILLVQGLGLIELHQEIEVLGLGTVQLKGGDEGQALALG